MRKGLFTSQEEIIFQRVYVEGNIPKKQSSDPNARRNPAKTQFLCSKKSNKRSPVYVGRVRY
ncbi:MAG: hypothetical protein IKQ99_02895 [Alphaproteobacteria bacterium]|nr:hypothetical protein [Alphaproteobacteria bacterium]